MDKRHRPWWILLTFFLSIPITSFSQKIENVFSEVSDYKINIYYDLLGIADDQPVFVKVFVSTDGGKSYGEALKSVIGDVGLVVGGGERRHIIWDVFEEVNELVSESVTFKVKADLLLSNQGKQLIDPGFMFNANANLGSKVGINSYGFNLKASIYVKQLGLGVRGGYFKTYGEHPDYPDFGYYWGFSGGAIIEYDIIKDPKYSIYPFFCIGQIKVEQKGENIPSEYSGYSIFYTPGVGLDIRVAKFLYLGVELEYYMAPVIDINDLGGSGVVDRIVLDGFCIGITFKFVTNPDK
ncbi:MAG TPA: hypothetical protein ENI20_14520 [Bacteroides sp.]|nr:hypothetical protein [Bacteroides sp.]